MSAPFRSLPRHPNRIRGSVIPTEAAVLSSRHPGYTSRPAIPTEAAVLSSRPKWRDLSFGGSNHVHDVAGNP